MKKAFIAVIALLFVFTTAVSANDGEFYEKAPTLEFSGVCGDYSAYLTWSANGNGAEIEKYEISCALAAVPDTVISTVTLPPSASSTTISGLSGGLEHIITLIAYNSAGITASSIRITPNDPDLATLTAVKNEIEASNVTVHLNIANTKEDVKSYLSTYFSKYADYGVKIKDIAVIDFTPAKVRTADDPDAEEGEFSYIVEIEKGGVSLSTKIISAVIDNSVSVVFLNASKFSVTTTETLTVTANALDIKDDTYLWYKAYGPTEEGTLIQGVTKNVYNVKTDSADEFYLYCVCGGVSSTRIKLTITEPFVAISDIELSTDTVTVSESSVLHSTVYPANATKSSVVWSIENDGGCIAELNGRTLVAYKPGTVTVKATVFDGITDGDYEKVFYISVKEKSGTTPTGTDTATETQDISKISTIEFDCSKIDGIEAVTVSAENGDIQITSVTDATVEKILSGSGIDMTANKVIGAVKFVYENGAIAHTTEIKIKGYDDKTVKILSVNSNGGLAIAEQKTVNGTVYGNAVSPDTVILVCGNTENSGVTFLIYALVLVIPAAAAAGFAAYIAIKGDRKRKKNKA